jgi:hypothetical protein
MSTYLKICRVVVLLVYSYNIDLPTRILRTILMQEREDVVRLKDVVVNARCIFALRENGRKETPLFRPESGNS